MKEVERLGSVTNQLLPLPRVGGGLLQVSWSATAHYGTSKKLIGADFMLREVTAKEITDHDWLTSSKMIYLLLAEQALSRADPDDVTNMRLRIYFVAQMQALFVLVARVAGRNAQQHMAERVNQLAGKSDYPINVDTGQINIDANWFSANACRECWRRQLSLQRR